MAQKIYLSQTRTFLLVFCFFIFSTIHAQSNLDSLYTVWQDVSEPDSSRIMAFEDYIFKGFVYTYPDSAISLASRLNNFSEKRDNKKGILK